MDKNNSEKRKKNCGQIFDGHLRNGIAVRMPDDLEDAIAALPLLYSLKKSIPEYCGIFVLTFAANRQLYRMLDCVDDTVLLSCRNGFWNNDERRQLKRLRPGAAVMLKDSFIDRLCIRLARVPEIYSRRDVMRRFNGIIHKMPELHIPCGAYELCGVVPDLFYHPLVLMIAPSSGGEGYGHYENLARYWIRRGGIAVFCGGAGNFTACEKIRMALSSKKCFNLCGKTDLFALSYAFRMAAYCIVDDPGLKLLCAAAGNRGMSISDPSGEYEDLQPPDWKILSPAKGRNDSFELLRFLNKEISRYNIPAEKYRKNR